MTSHSKKCLSKQINDSIYILNILSAHNLHNLNHILIFIQKAN